MLQVNLFLLGQGALGVVELQQGVVEQVASHDVAVLLCLMIGLLGLHQTKGRCSLVPEHLHVVRVILGDDVLHQLLIIENGHHAAHLDVGGRAKAVHDIDLQQHLEDLAAGGASSVSRYLKLVACLIVGLGYQVREWIRYLVVRTGKLDAASCL